MVDALKTYELAFSGLSLGEHRFQYHINERFFECFEASEIKNGSVKVDVLLVKNQRLMELEIGFHGDVELQCDRCLDLFRSPVKDLRMLYIKYENDPSDISDDEDIILISERDHKINLAQHFYEFIHLCLPVKRIHPEDESGTDACNPEMIARLKDYSVDHGSAVTDDRWNELKKAFTNMKLNN